MFDPDGVSAEWPIRGEQALIGKARHCDVPLSGWRIGREHARIVRTRQGLILEDLGQFAGTWVNGARVVRHGPLSFADQIQIAGYRLRVQDGEAASASAHLAQPQRNSLESRESRTVGETRATTIEKTVATREDAAAQASDESQLGHIQARHPWRKRIHDQLLDTIDLRRRDLTRMSDLELRAETEKLVREILDNLHELPSHIDREALSREVLDEAIGLGPLEQLLGDETVTEVMVNRHDEIFVERSGRLQRYPLAFTSDRAVMGVIERIVAPLGRRIDESSPLVDARLKDGSRVNAIIPPLALKGPTLTIRKFSSKRMSAQDLVAYGSLSPQMVAFLKLCVEHRKNMIVSGGTGSGKTTFLNVLSNFIPDGERIITIEDAAELKLNHSHLVSLESRPSNVEGRGAITIRDLVRNSLRMRPDRIVVGECRGGEALDMLQAMNTGHEGSLTTAHANSPRDALSRLEVMVMMSGMDLPVAAIREQIASAVDIVVQQTRFACGSRKITSIAEITGIENGRIQLQELFR
ncbi:MAG TPA: ATPase, T2SS/T4P/T4SS family, partial [Burkholderiaceae bacterium]|nr:ATPase, T2SS/T4P/T4SS family [Burkholderiaceae bacterium]